MENGILITEATSEHLPQLVEMFEAYRDFYGQRPDKLGALQFLTTRLRQKDSLIFVAEHRKRVVGFAQMYPLFSSLQMKRLWLLNDVYVDPEYRKRTVGRQLIDHCKAQARKTKAQGLLLEAEKTNTLGNKLYQRTGFALDSEHNYYFWENQI